MSGCKQGLTDEEAGDGAMVLMTHVDDDNGGFADNEYNVFKRHMSILC